MNQSDTPLDLVHASTAARLAGVSVSTIRLWVLSGKLPAIITAEGVRLLRREDVERLARTREQGRARAVPAIVLFVTALLAPVPSFAQAPTQPLAGVFHNTTQSLSVGVATAITFNSEDFDVGAMHDTSMNTSRLTVPTGGDGLYLMMAQITFAANGTNGRKAYWRKNGSTVICGQASATPV